MAAVHSRLKDLFSAKSIGTLLQGKKIQKVIGSNIIQSLDAFINNHFMVKLRQKECREQEPKDDLATYLQTHFCSEPFQHLETTHTGLAFVCCPVWLPTPIGTMDTDPKLLWDGAVAKDIRASIVDGSFRHCNHRHCPAITNRALVPRESAEAQQHIRAFETGSAPALPTKVSLSHDKSCNLSCPSCRGSLYMANKAKQASLDDLNDRFVLPLLEHTRTVLITGSGDPFGSKHFRNLIKKITPERFPNLKLNLITNGQLMNERAWIELRLAGRVENVHVSVDATKSETYRIVRRGGTFERLLENLRFIRDLRLKGDISRLEFSMVVQGLNFREMPDFVALGREFAADGVYFQMIRKRDIFSGDEFRGQFIGSPDHPDHAEFVDLMKGDWIHDAGTMPPLEIGVGNVLAYLPR